MNASVKLGYLHLTIGQALSHRQESKITMAEMTHNVLLRIARGDQSAVEDCLSQYGGLVWSLCRRFCSTVSDAEDAAQEVFIELWRSASRFDAAKASETTFIAMIARRRLIDRLRQQRGDVQTEMIDEHAVETTGPEVGLRAELSDDAAQARECLQKLRTEEQSVIDLTVCKGDSQSVASAKLGIPLGTVKSHARRALVKLRDCMKGHAFGLSGGEV